jgi:hypothetical protein
MRKVCLKDLHIEKVTVDMILRSILRRYFVVRSSRFALRLLRAKHVIVPKEIEKRKRKKYKKGKRQRKKYKKRKRQRKKEVQKEKKTKKEVQKEKKTKKEVQKEKKTKKEVQKEKKTKNT